MALIKAATVKALPIIFLWYFTNGLNSVCVHKFLKEFKSHNDKHDSVDSNDILTFSSNPSLFSSWIAVVTITALQLLLGTLISFTALLLCTAVETVSNSNTIDNRFNQKRRPLQTAKRDIIDVLTLRQLHHANSNVLNLVHAAGSFFTTLGIYYGSATLVQIIKLLEPFETLVLAEYVLPLLTGGPKWSNITTGIFMSMSINVISSVSLVFATETTKSSTSKKQTPDTFIQYSILASIASGCTLSLRNVLLKSTTKVPPLPNHPETQNMDEELGTEDKKDQEQSTLTKKKLFAHAENTHNENDKVSRKKSESEEEKLLPKPESRCKNPKNELSKFQTQLLNFGKLSYMSGLWNLLFLLILMTTVIPLDHYHGSSYQALKTSWGLMNLPTIVYHPLYNFFSILTLDSTTVLTHSLLNVGKRIWSVCMSIYYFRQKCSFRLILSMTMALGGGIWYTMEKEKAKRRTQKKKLTEG